MQGVRQTFNVIRVLPLVEGYDTLSSQTKVLRLRLSSYSSISARTYGSCK